LIFNFLTTLLFVLQIQVQNCATPRTPWGTTSLICKFLC